MRVVYTDEALENLAGILAYIAEHYPTIRDAFQNPTIRDAFQTRLQSVVTRIGDWPESAQEFCAERGGRT